MAVVVDQKGGRESMMSTPSYETDDEDTTRNWWVGAGGQSRVVEVNHNGFAVVRIEMGEGGGKADGEENV